MHPHRVKLMKIELPSQSTTKGSEFESKRNCDAVEGIIVMKVRPASLRCQKAGRQEGRKEGI